MLEGTEHGLLSQPLDLIYCYDFFISSTFFFFWDFIKLSSLQPLPPLTLISWPLTPAQMVFPKINHGFLSADQQLIKRRLIKVALDHTLLF